MAHCKLLPSIAFPSAVVNMALRWATQDVESMRRALWMLSA
ncbi:hypothetical protein [Gemmiger formicilis]